MLSIGDRYNLQSERVIFYPIIPDQAIYIGRHWLRVGRLSGVKVVKAVVVAYVLFVLGVFYGFEGFCYMTALDLILLLLN